MEPLSCQEMREEYHYEVGKEKRGREIVYIVFIVVFQDGWECKGQDESEGIDRHMHKHLWAQTLSSAYNCVLVHT